MDARITRDLRRQELHNIETGKVEADGLMILAAKDLQNVLWSRGIKTRIVPVDGSEG
jgi:hypothetical protein